jgi:hypothetical protein
VHWSFENTYKGINNSLRGDDFIERFRLSDKAFTRERDLPFHRLVSFMLNLRKSGSEQELKGFFATLEDQPIASESASRSAFCKARKKLSYHVFTALNTQAIGTFREGWATPLWHGFRLFGVDGTTLRLPAGKEIETFFGEQTSGPTLARASTLYDLGHDLVVDARLASTCVSEHELAIAHLDATRPGDLLVYDRNYPAFWFMAMHLARGIEFCMRLPRKRFSAADAFWASDEDSAVVTLNPSAEQRRDCRDQDLCPEPLRVRLVRVRLKGGETEVLVTSILDEERLPARLFGQLYHRRWNTEESYKRQKRWLEIENISGHSVLAVRQDVHAKILALNLTAMLRAVAQLIAARHFDSRKYAYQVVWCSALSAMKHNIVRLVTGLTHDRLDLLNRLIRQLCSAVDAIRPDRSFPRSNPGKLKPGFHKAYRRAA